MADAGESFRRPTSSDIAWPLQYPTLPPLTASVEEWLSHSRLAGKTDNMMSGNPTDPPPKPLSESWATLSVSDLHSEDGSRSEPTDIASLMDQATPDDVASLDERDIISDAEAPDNEYTQDDEEEDQLEPRSNAASQQFPSLYAPPGPAIDDSNLTTRPSFRQSLDSIEFVEPEKWPEMERVELKRMIHVFEGEAASEMRTRLPYNPIDSVLLATVQQTMTKQSLDLDKPFRVLYIGHPEFRNIILDKIGDVLVSSSAAGSQTSSTESSRYHVVPTSFGIGAVPNFAELLPIHVQLVVDECTEANADLHGVRPSTLHLNFKNRPSCHSWWDDSMYQVSSTTEWTLPDVAIIFIAAHESPAAVKTRGLAHVFLERHGIPAMVISQEAIWKGAGEIVPINHHSLHMCLETRNKQTGETAVLKRYPIDLENFENMTPSQLNRNLASLMDLYPKKTLKATPDTPVPKESFSSVDPKKYPGHSIPPTYATRVSELAPLLRLALLVLVSGIGATIGYAGLKAMSIFLAQLIAGSALSHSLSQPTPTVLPMMVPTLEGVRQRSLSIRSSGNIDLLNSQFPDCAVPKPAGLAISAPDSSADTDSFEIQVVGDCHVFIKPPRSFVAARKQPRFEVGVFRYAKPLPHELFHLFDDVYAVRLNRQDAYGLVNVTITANSKPRVNQTMLADFGTPWLKIENWRRAARSISHQFTTDLQIAQTGLTEAYGHFVTDLQVIVGDVVKRSHYLRENAERLRRESLNPENGVLSRSKQLSEVITHNAVQQFRSASSLLHSRSVIVNRRAKGIVSTAWGRLGASAGKVDIRSVMDRVRDTNSAALHRAQTRARHLVGRREEKSS
ncbi:hypothetical protein N7532_005484 [Penicillium argentinense]|uniref:Uncharacterized protein n=1 Tax=Penicillium argentinense TaxID=1131581 RepID=A0A9W9FDZ9_9EURO|nr:uncharacterized protein N7532_005484 [Penicillium argentinense]KAJ5098483.1 hypothetical protein N7532_005484 [Penicillium argentinense]